MNKKQIVIIVAVIAVTGYLYSLPVKGLVKPKATRSNSGVAGNDRPAAAANINVATVSAAAKTAIGAALSAKINDLENQLKNAPENNKPELEKQLASQWDDDNQPTPAAFYYLSVARKENKYEDWLNAGNRFNDSYKLTQDTSSQALYTSNAAEAFQNALKLKPESLDGKTGLGIAYVNGAGMPMQGIALLLEVVKQDPKNVTANLNLGMFSMKSGQYPKAIDRFKTVIATKPGFEPYFYLAETYKQLGKKTEAIAAYQKCKEMMPDPVFGQRIDEYIKELKN
jgi:tetratricopeptide (TPR) repeat protein